jgi:hypothetical protein
MRFALGYWLHFSALCVKAGFVRIPESLFRPKAVVDYYVFGHNTKIYLQSGVSEQHLYAPRLSSRWSPYQKWPSLIPGKYRDT